MSKLILFTSFFLILFKTYSQSSSTIAELRWDEKIKQAEKLIKKKEYSPAIEICSEILNYQLFETKEWGYYLWRSTASDILVKVYSDKKNIYFDEKIALKYLNLKYEDLNSSFKLYAGPLKENYRAMLLQSKLDLDDYLVKTKLNINDIKDVAEANSNNIKESGKTVLLTAVGYGVTIDDARLKALRSAIEQAFGAFVSSNTTILNDQMIKDDIISINSGNIEKYDIMNESKLTNGSFVTTLKVLVSVNKLINYSQSKGVSLEFQGGLFASNILIQELNDRNELLGWRNLKIIIDEILKNSFNYQLKYETPQKKENNWCIPLEVSISYNSNFESILNLVFDFMKAITLTNSDVNEYIKTNRNVFPIVYALDDNIFGQFFLRNEVVRDSIFMIPQHSFITSLNNFIIDNGIESKDFPNYLKYFENYDYKVFLNDNTQESDVFIGGTGNDLCYSNGLLGKNGYEMVIKPFKSDNFKFTIDSEYHKLFSFNGLDLERFLYFSEHDGYRNPKLIIEGCLAGQRLIDKHSNFSFTSKINLSSTNFESTNFMKSIPITSFKLLKANNYKLFTIKMSDIYSLDKIKSITNYRIFRKNI